MSRDAKNSILLWIGALVLAGLFWAALHFDIGAGIPDRWLWPVIGVLIAVDVLLAAWGYLRKRKPKAR
ncbi:MAG: hypothetical protein WC068_15760 [Caulobacter sp.]